MSKFNVGDMVPVAAMLCITGKQKTRKGDVTVYQTDIGLSIHESIIEQIMLTAHEAKSEQPAEKSEPDKPVQKPIKLYCVKDSGGVCGFKQGEVYEEWNGRIYPSNGCHTGYSPDWFKEHFVRLVKRPAKVGEWVYVTDASNSPARYNLSVGSVLQASGECIVDKEGYIWGAALGFLDKDGGCDYLVLDGYKPEPTPMTIDEISKALGYAVKVVQG